MNDNNKIINQHLRCQLIRKWVVYILFALLFVGFMSYALYKEHGSISKDKIVTEQPKQKTGQVSETKVLDVLSIAMYMAIDLNKPFKRDIHFIADT